MCGNLEPIWWEAEFTEAEEMADWAVSETETDGKPMSPSFDA